MRHRAEPAHAAKTATAANYNTTPGKNGTRFHRSARQTDAGVPTGGTRVSMQKAAKSVCAAQRKTENCRTTCLYGRVIPTNFSTPSRAFGPGLPSAPPGDGLRQTTVETTAVAFRIGTSWLLSGSFRINRGKGNRIRVPASHPFGETQRAPSAQNKICPKVCRETEIRVTPSGFQAAVTRNVERPLTG